MSVDPVTGCYGNEESTFPDVSADGRYVAYGSRATNLGPNDGNGGRFDIYLKDGEIHTRSEDVIALAPPDWTQEEIEILKTNRAMFEMKDARELEGTAVRHRLRNPFRASLRSP